MIPLNRVILDQNSRRVRELLLGICPALVANAERLSDVVRYFPVSAFGHTPLKIGPGDYVPDPTRLSPFLLEIPPLWILSRFCPALVPVSGNGKLETVPHQPGA